MSDHVDYLDGWRGLAILLVLIAHFAPIPGLDSGRLGVDLFFVLSGLLMSRILYERRTPLATFYKRRASRILPAMLLLVLVGYIFADLRGLPFSGREVLMTLTFSGSYFGHSMWDMDAPVGQL